MAHVVIVGAGIAGVPAAYEIRERLGNGHSVTVVNKTDYFQFVPSNVWLAVGWRERTDITLPIGQYLARKDINFIPKGVKKIDAPSKQLTLDGEETLSYDYLVIATGPQLSFDEVLGAGPSSSGGGGFSHSVCSVDHAEMFFVEYQKLLKDPGPIIVGAMPGASCFGPAYELAFILDTDLRRKKLRHLVPITFVSSEPYIGHLGLAGVGDSKSMLESELRDRDVKWIVNAKTTKLEAGMMFVAELDDLGGVHKEHALAFKLSMMLPAFRGIDAVAAVPGLCNSRGFVIVDEYQRSKTYKDVFAAGVCVAIPPVEVTPVATGTPKSGYMIESMVSAIAHNIAADVRGEVADVKGTWNAICLADMGDRGVVFVALPQIPPRNMNWFAKGRWVHFAKIAFEKYFMRKIRKGHSEPMYEKYVLKALGIARLVAKSKK